MTTGKFATLDGLRGLAALAVLLYHLQSPLHVAANAGYLAVDLFFLMSGFVVAGAYEARLRSGWSVGAFMLVRLRRLWPLYAIGLLLGVICFEAVRMLRPDLGIIFPDISVATAALIGLLLLPVVQNYGGPSFPFNGASWSLSIEVFGNLAYAALARTLRTQMLFAMIAVGFAGLVAILFRVNHLDVGVDGLGPGYIRFLFSFPFGVLLYRLHVAGSLPIPRVPIWLPLAASAVLLAAPFGHGGIIDLLVVCIGFPLILVLSLNQPSSQRVMRFLGWMGATSYPLYILHLPLLNLAVVMVGSHPDALTALALDVAIITVAALAGRFIDRPLQQRFKFMAANKSAILADA